MDNVNLPFQMKDKNVLNELLENLNVVLKDSDAVAEKEIVKQFLREISDVITIAILGNKGVGKTSLLNAIFNEDLGSSSSTQEICEYRYGAKDNAFQLDTKVIRYFKIKETLQGIAIVDMPGCDVWNRYEIEKVAIEYLNKSDVIISIFSADSVNAYDVWDVLEKIDNKNIVFALNKSDCVSEKILNEAELRLRQYMLDAGIYAPIFKISSVNEKIGKKEKNELVNLCDFINNNIIGENPILSKQTENVVALKNMLIELENSFALRHKQYELDKIIASNINQVMNSFCEKSNVKIEHLKSDIAKVIDREMDAYQDEIVRRLNPKQIKERFPNGVDDFMEYLEFVNENYQKRMLTEIEKRTQGYVRSYLTELQDVYTEAIGYFQNRDSLLALEDKFYGSLAESKSIMVSETSYQLTEAKKYYGSVTDASEELFLKTWEERKKYDAKVVVEKWGSGVVVGGVVGVVLASVFSGWVGVLGAIASGILSYDNIGQFFAEKSLETMEKRVNEYVVEFRVQVDAAKEDMKAQILSSIEEIFTTELSNADKSFIDFRMSVNIDSKNIPLLESKLGKIHLLMGQIEEMEKECKLIC